MSRTPCLLAVAAGFQSALVAPYAAPTGRYGAAKPVVLSNAGHLPAQAYAVALPSASAAPRQESFAAWAVPVLVVGSVAAAAARLGSTRPVQRRPSFSYKAVTHVAPLRRTVAPARLPALTMKVDMPGECPPLGFFDPLGFSKDASPETMKKYREAELKHGRVAMLASFGMILADRWHPLFGGKNSANPLLAATQTPKLGWLQILTFIMFIEVLGILNSRRPDYQPGDFLGSSQWETDEGWKSYQTKELNNGRLAMFGSIGMLVGSYITGKGPLEVMDAGNTIVF